jgi:hypothetical protein
VPTSLAAVTVLVLAVVPGAFGEYAWSLVNGQDWRKKEWETALGFLSFSVIGLALYVCAGLVIPLPPAVHVIPSTYEATTLNAAGLSRVFLPYLGHIVASTLVGIVAALAHRGISAVFGLSPQPSAWDHFIKKCVPGRWVVVTLKSGDVFAGYIETAEQAAPANERDVVLHYPAKRDETTQSYKVTSLNDLFLPADLVQNIGTIRLDSELAKDPAVSTSLFSQPHSNGQATEANASATAPT